MFVNILSKSLLIHLVIFDSILPNFPVFSADLNPLHR